MIRTLRMRALARALRTRIDLRGLCRASVGVRGRKLAVWAVVLASLTMPASATTIGVTMIEPSGFTALLRDGIETYAKTKPDLSVTFAYAPQGAGERQVEQVRISSPRRSMPCWSCRSIRPRTRRSRGSRRKPTSPSSTPIWPPARIGLPAVSRSSCPTISSPAGCRCGSSRRCWTARAASRSSRPPDAFGNRPARAGRQGSGRRVPGTAHRRRGGGGLGSSDGRDARRRMAGEGQRARRDCRQQRRDGHRGRRRDRGCRDPARSDPHRRIDATPTAWRRCSASAWP